MMNEAMLAAVGYERAEVVGTDYTETFIPESDRELLAGIFENFVNSKESTIYESHVLTKDGRKLLVEWHSRPLLKENGEIHSFLCVGIDITERKQSEKELLESEERFRAVFEGSLDAILLADPESGEVIDANPAAEELLLRPREEIIGLHQTQLHPAHLKSSVEKMFSRHAEAAEQIESPFESYVLRSDGREIPVEILSHIIQIDGVPVLYGTFRDISQRKRIEEALVESEQRYRLLAESMYDIVWTSDMDLRFNYVSPSVERFVGYTPEELIGKTIIEHLTPSSAEAATKVFLEEFTGEDAKASDLLRSRTMELQRLHKNGSVVWGELTFTFLRDTKGRLEGILGVTRDITERKKAEQALQESEERYRSLFDESPIALWELDFSYAKSYTDELRGKGIVDFRTYFQEHPEELAPCIKKTRITDINKATVKLYKARSKQGFLDAISKVIAKGFYGEFVEELIGITEGKTVFGREVATWTFEGEEKHIQYRCSVAPGHEKTFSKVLVSIIDITDRKKMEEEALKIEKLESLGILAGGIAHDFNNILTPILSNISMARIYGELGSEIEDMLRDAEKATLRAKSLTQQLLTFSKGGAPVKRIASISQLLRDSSRFALSGSNVRCEASLPRDLWAVEMDEAQIGQVINNVVINSDQASPMGGTIEISAENVVIGQKDSLPLKEGKYVRISIADSGIGIPKEHLSKIFDPFYTTKLKGSGLGLSTSFTIIKQHEGTIQVQSEVGVGTTFDIYLPASEEVLVIEEKRWERAKTGQGRILLVDDEEPVRISVGAILKRLGYEVKFAENGTEGIRAYEKAMKEERPFDVVILDLTIPGELGGKKAVKRLKGIDPKAKVIVSSGYSEDQVMSRFREHGFDGVLVKPYGVADLAAVIRKVLADGQETR
jgi:PAS domain S-box-containing protein